MKFKDKINTPATVTFLTLTFITGIQYVLLFLYTNHWGFHPTFIQSTIEISIIFLLNSVGYTATQIYRKKKEKQKFDIIKREETEQIGRAHV